MSSCKSNKAKKGVVLSATVTQIQLKLILALNEKQEEMINTNKNLIKVKSEM